MVSPIFVDAVIYASLLSLMSIGLTLTYMTTKVPNFAHGAFVSVGNYVAFTLAMIFGIHPYASIPVAFIMAGLVALIQYLFVLRPLIERGASIMMQMIATLAFNLIMIGALNAYADFITRTFKVQARDVSLQYLDFKILGVPALAFIAPLTTAVLVLALHEFLTKTKFGIALRAAIENPSLAEVMGVNTKMAYAFSWFLAGGLAGISGALLTLKFFFNPNTGWIYLLSIFAASIVGGLYSLYGAILGGLLLGFIEILGTTYLALFLNTTFGIPTYVVTQYRPLVPMIALAITLLVLPQGLASINWSRLIGRLFRRS